MHCELRHAQRVLGLAVGTLYIVATVARFSVNTVKFTVFPFEYRPERRVNEVIGERG